MDRKSSVNHCYNSCIFNEGAGAIKPPEPERKPGAPSAQYDNEHTGELGCQLPIDQPEGIIPHTA